MQIIEEIKNDILVNHPSEIQKLCIDKLKSKPLPNVKSELWRLSNKTKFSSFLNYSFNNKEFNLDLPYENDSQNIIRLIIGENNLNNCKGKNYSIRKSTDKEIAEFIKKNISDFIKMIIGAIYSIIL